MADEVLKKQLLRNNEYYDIQEKYDELYNKSKCGQKFNKLMELIENRNNILLAYRNIKNNNGSKTAGTDGRTIDYYKNWTIDNFVNYIRNQLRNYKPKTVKRVEIPKPNGDFKPLGIPTIEDRIIQ